VVALATGYIYLVTYIYEAGFCMHFGIPSHFVQPNLTTILVAAVAIGFTFLARARPMALNFLGFSAPLIRVAANPTKAQEPYRLLAGMNAVLLVTIIVFAAAYGLSWKWFLLSVAGVMVLNSFFGVNLLFDRKGKSLRERFERINRAQDSAPFTLRISSLKG
jgi:hypothetical protein